MNISHLYSAILKGKWAIEPRFMDSLYPIVSGLFDRNMSNSFDGEAPELILQIASNETVLESVNAFGEEKSGSVFDSAPKGSIAIIPLKGTMLKEDTMCAYGTRTIGSVMLEAVAHENISGIILDIDSGGGAVDAIAPIKYAIEKAHEAKMKVLALADMAASAAYYAASFADHIMADNNISSEFGSIGVMVSFQDVQPYYEEMGVKFHTIYAPESTHKNQGFELARQGKYELIKKETLSPLAKDFMRTVRNNRNGKVNLTIPGILNGRMFYAKEAKKHGLIDSMGNIDLAIRKLNKISN